MITAHDLEALEVALRSAPQLGVDVGRAPPPADELVPALAQAVHASRSAIILTDAQLDEPGPIIRYVNPACELLTGYRADELIGRNPRLFQGDATDRQVLTRLRNDMAAGRSSEGQVINYRADGTPFVNSWRIAPVRGDRDEVTAFVAIQEDVTESWLGELHRHQELGALRATLAAPQAPELDHLQIVCVQRLVDDRSQLGGDWSDVIVGPDDRVHIIVGDVTGHGVVAALHIGRFRWALHALLRAGMVPSQALTILNQINTEAPAFASMGIVSVDPDGRRAEVLTAGHPDVMIVRHVDAQDGEKVTVQRIRSDDSLLGVTGAGADGPATCTELDVGDVVLIYSDGLVDRRTGDVDEGMDRLEAWLTADPPPGDDLEEYARTLISGLAGATPDDDVVILATLVTARPR